jgi:competence protein ComEC
MVSPEIAVISLSETNRFGFPHAEVLKRYKDLGIKVLRTSRRGGIKISSKNGKIVVLILLMFLMDSLVIR